MVERKENTHIHFHTAQDKYQNLPYVLGKSDCFQFIWCVLDAILTEESFAELPKIKAYKDTKTAKAALKATGYKTIEHMFDDLFTPRDLNFLTFGDIVKVPQGIHAMGGYGIVSYCGKLALIAGEEGLDEIPKSYWIKGWAV